MKKIIIRLDDICPDMNYENFIHMRNILLKERIKPLIGVIPNNKDEKLMKERSKSIFKTDEEIWNEIKILQDKHGWQVALHGYEHIKKTNNGGIMKYNSKSEFAGVPFDEQHESIKKGKEILNSLGLICSSFMAPSHSFDDNTLKALRREGIDIITDGYGVFPYMYRGCVMMPVPYSLYRRLPIGIYTVCLHPNTMQKNDFDTLEKFIRRERRNIIPFLQGVSLYKKQKNGLMNVVNIIMNMIMLSSVIILKKVNLLRNKR